jgi:hypothetical protein
MTRLAKQGASMSDAKQDLKLSYCCRPRHGLSSGHHAVCRGVVGRGSNIVACDCDCHKQARTEPAYVKPCSHRHVRLEIDFEAVESPEYQLRCKACLTSTQPMQTGMAALRVWLHDQRVQTEQVQPFGFSHSTARP